MSRRSQARTRNTFSRVRRRSLAFEQLEDRRLLAAVRDLPGLMTNSLGNNDDGSSGAVDIGFQIDFFGTNYSQLYVNNNGNITFGDALEDWTPTNLSQLDIPIIAPFWADVDTTNVSSGAVTYGEATLNGHRAFGVNWLNVGYFEQHTDRLNSFQLILVDRSDVQAGAFEIEFNYDSINWDTGDAVGEGNDLGSASARIGYSDGSGVLAKSFELDGSGIGGAFLDSNEASGLVHGSRRSAVAGSYVFQFPVAIHYDFPLDNIPDTHTVLNRDEFLTGPSNENPLDIARNYLNENAANFGLIPADLAASELANNFTSGVARTTYLHFQQVANGLPITNGVINISIAAGGEVISAGSSFVPGLSTAPPGTPTPSRSILTAISDAANALGISLQTPPVLVTPPTKYTDTAIVIVPDLSLESIPVRLTYVPTDDGVQLAWNMVLRLPDGNNWLDLSVSTDDGSVAFGSNWIDEASYNVYPRSVENPNDGGRTIVVNPQDPISSPFGWHDTNGVAGAEFTDTRGNNVFAQEDADNNNAGGARPNGGALLNFTSPINLAAAPATYTNASTTNLFYLGNVLHDIHYRYGFDEVSGNFQVNNYGKGGAGGDAVQADSQDGSGFNNANFGTPPDGTSPRMQQFIFNVTTPFRDASLENTIPIHEYGHGVSNRLTGGPANSNALNAIQSAGMGEGWGDWWGLMFTQKTTDLKNGAYPIGTYVFGQATNGPGIRTVPYSYSFAADNLTFARIGGLTDPHSIGEVWASALWDLNWLLIDKYGFDPNIQNGYWPGGSGNSLALQLVMDGLKLQPANPSFLDARNAILLADTVLTGGANQREIWHAFARRGMGLSATTAGANTTTVTEAFDFPEIADTFEVNNTIASATVLGSPATVTLNDLTIDSAHDVDFFAYTAHETGKAIVSSYFTHGNGDLNLDIYDASGKIIGFSYGANDNETLIIPVVAQQRYFIHVFGVGGAINNYALEIENFAAPVPTSVDLTSTSDAGTRQDDNITNDRTPVFRIQADVASFGLPLLSAFQIDPNGDGLATDASLSGAGVYVTIASNVRTVSGFANPVGTSGFLWAFNPVMPLPDDDYTVSAAVQIVDNQTVKKNSRTTLSAPLPIVIDTLKPNVVFGDPTVPGDGLDPNSDSGVAGRPATNIDRITNDTTPTFWGYAEANSIVRVFALDSFGFRVLLGETVAVPFSGNNPAAYGRWSLTSTVDMNDPLFGFPALDGLRNFEADAVDVAGNISQGVGIASNTPQAINDNTTNDYLLFVSNYAEPITNLTVGLDITHAFDADLDVYLISPSGTVVELFTDVGEFSSNFTNTMLDDSASLSIADPLATAPHTGTFRPEGMLSAFNGEIPNGVWTLRIIDDDMFITGVLNNWSLCFQSTLDAFIDTQGPQVTSVFVTGTPGYDLFGSKPTAPTPTPLVNSLSVRIQDLPARAANFLYSALANDATSVGYFSLVGDSTGNIPIDKVVIATDVVAIDQPATGTILIQFVQPLPDDRFTLTIRDGIVDVAGNRLDGESNFIAPGTAPIFPTGNTIPGADFVARFTVDSRPEIGVWAAGIVQVDTNGNLRFDPDNLDLSNRDLAYTLGFSSDYVFAGNFVLAATAVADRFDKLAVYGRVGNQWRFLIDLSNDGVPDIEVPGPAINGIPVAGNFDGKSSNGDEVGIFTGSAWFFDTDHDFIVDAGFATTYAGFPVVGDFDGDGDDDLGTYTATQAGGNSFVIDINTANAGIPIAIDGLADNSFRIGLAGLGSFGFAGVRERPVAADMNADGVDDLGLWVPDGAVNLPSDQSAWLLLVSKPARTDVAGNLVPRETIIDRIFASPNVNFVPFSTTPFGSDLFARFGSSFGLPIVGNFDPPVSNQACDSGIARMNPATTVTSSVPQTSSKTTSKKTTATVVQGKLPATNSQANKILNILVVQPKKPLTIPAPKPAAKPKVAVLPKPAATKLVITVAPPVKAKVKV